MTAHTPGPWRASGQGIEARAFDGSWKWITPVVHGGTPGEASANRALMAAAPDLLDALMFAEAILSEHVASSCDMCGGEGGWSEGADGGHPTPVRHKDGCEYLTVRAAIAKAEGR